MTGHNESLIDQEECSNLLEYCIKHVNKMNGERGPLLIDSDIADLEVALACTVQMPHQASMDRTA